MDGMDRFCALSVLLLLSITSVITRQPHSAVEISRNDSEGRGWTPPYDASKWKTTTTNHPVTVRTTPAIRKTVCDSSCCRCELKNTQIKCKQSLNCREFTLTGDILPKEAKIIILTGFSRLKIHKNSLFMLSHFQSLSIEQVNEIEMEPSALSLPPSCERKDDSSLLIISASSIRNFKRRTLTGGWKEIVIMNSTLGVIESETFYDTKCLKKLTLEKNIISQIMSRTQTNGEAQYLNIKDNDIKIMEHGAIDLRVTESAIISHNVIDEIQSETFALKSPRIFKFINNTVGNIYQHAFQLEAKERIDIISNNFGRVSRHAFHQLQIRNQTKVIIGMSIKKFDKGALDLHETITVSALQIVDIKLDQDCVCNLEVSVNQLFTEFTKDSQNDSTSIKTVVRDSVSCRVQNRTEKAIAFTFSCKTPKVALIASITVTLVTILVLIAVVAVVAIRQRANNPPKCLETTNRVMRVYTEIECRVEEEFALPLETVNDI